MYPIDALTEEDKDTIQAYIYEYGYVLPQDIDKVLSSWNKSKIKLFKIMGRKLRISKEVEIPINKDIIFNELDKIYPDFTTHWRDIYSETRKFGCDFTKELERYLFTSDFDGYTNTHSIEYLFNKNRVYENSLAIDINFYSKSLGNLNLRWGTKTMKGIRKFCEYCGFFDSVPEGMALYEEFRNRVSDVLTKTKIKGRMVMSIHPLDYITMSDNNCGWSSCLSWETGCYYGGTVELMNSNLAVVCYLVSEKPYLFYSLKGGKKHRYFIPNKSWRCVYFAHKQILLTGNPYPYYNQNLCDIGLDWLYELVYNNIHWDYKYKKQPYGDMIHRCNNEYTRTDQRYAPWDHNDIIVYTYGLYNDFNVLDHTVNCYRNPVKKNLRLSLSGRGTCLSCGGPVDFEDQKGASYKYNSDFDFKTHQSGEKLVCRHCDCG